MPFSKALQAFSLKVTGLFNSDPQSTSLVTRGTRYPIDDDDLPGIVKKGIQFGSDFCKNRKDIPVFWEMRGKGKGAPLNLLDIKGFVKNMKSDDVRMAPIKANGALERIMWRMEIDLKLGNNVSKLPVFSHENQDAFLGNCVYSFGQVRAEDNTTLCLPGVFVARSTLKNEEEVMIPLIPGGTGNLKGVLFRFASWPCNNANLGQLIRSISEIDLEKKSEIDGEILEKVKKMNKYTTNETEILMGETEVSWTLAGQKVCIDVLGTIPTSSHCLTFDHWKYLLQAGNEENLKGCEFRHTLASMVQKDKNAPSVKHKSRANPVNETQRSKENNKALRDRVWEVKEAKRQAWEEKQATLAEDEAVNLQSNLWDFVERDSKKKDPYSTTTVEAAVESALDVMKNSIIENQKKSKENKEITQHNKNPKNERRVRHTISTIAAIRREAKFNALASALRYHLREKKARAQLAEKGFKKFKSFDAMKDQYFKTFSKEAWTGLFKEFKEQADAKKQEERLKYLARSRAASMAASKWHSKKASPSQSRGEPATKKRKVVKQAADGEGKAPLFTKEMQKQENKLRDTLQQVSAALEQLQKRKNGEIVAEEVHDQQANDDSDDDRPLTRVNWNKPIGKAVVDQEVASGAAAFARGDEDAAREVMEQDDLFRSEPRSWTNGRPLIGDGGSASFDSDAESRDSREGSRGAGAGGAGSDAESRDSRKGSRESSVEGDGAGSPDSRKRSREPSVGGDGSDAASDAGSRDSRKRSRESSVGGDAGSPILARGQGNPVLKAMVVVLVRLMSLIILMMVLLLVMRTIRPRHPAVIK